MMKTEHVGILSGLTAFVVLCLTMYGCNSTSEVELTKRQAIVGPSTNAPELKVRHTFLMP